MFIQLQKAVQIVVAVKRTSDIKDKRIVESCAKLPRVNVPECVRSIFLTLQLHLALFVDGQPRFLVFLAIEQ
jgi:hypothetical protein